MAKNVKGSVQNLIQGAIFALTWTDSQITKHFNKLQDTILIYCHAQQLKANVSFMLSVLQNT